MCGNKAWVITENKSFTAHSLFSALSHTVGVMAGHVHGIASLCTLGNKSSFCPELLCSEIRHSCVNVRTSVLFGIISIIKFKISHTHNTFWSLKVLNLFLLQDSLSVCRDKPGCHTICDCPLLEPHCYRFKWQPSATQKWPVWSQKWLLQFEWWHKPQQIKKACEPDPAMASARE